mgnify:CR=1 FL=1
MSEPENISAIMPRSLGELDENLQRKILRQEILNHWAEIFDVIAPDVEFVKIEGGVLTVTSLNAAARDFIKYGAAKFVEKINLAIGVEYISRIELGRPARFQMLPLKKNPAPAEKKTAVEVELTAEEIAECEKKAAVLRDDDQRQIVLETLLSHAKAEKFRQQSGWHKCARCELLVPPQETICAVCRVKERERLRKKIRRIFCDAPWTPFSEVREKVAAEFPYLQSECTLDAVESARMDLILQTAARVSYGDTTSDAAKFLVMLIRQLPREKLTPQIISRTLQEFQYNLADRPSLDSRGFIKLPPTYYRRIKKSAAFG